MKNRRHSLAEAMGYRKKARKVTINELRRLIENEILLEEEEKKDSKDKKEKEVD